MTREPPVKPVGNGSWLSTPLGRRYLANEQRLTKHALERVFGEQFVQIGCWGTRDTFLRYARTQRRVIVDWRVEKSPDVISETEQLALASDSVDVVLLPHTLEQVPSPHALLREVDRILRADGHLFVLSFAPGGVWGLRHLLSAQGYPRGRERMIREGRLRDWLELLSFEVGGTTRYCHTLPIEDVKQKSSWRREEWAQRWLPFLAGGYLLRAQKRVRPLTPVRTWKPARLRAVGGLVEPTTRASVTELATFRRNRG